MSRPGFELSGEEERTLTEAGLAQDGDASSDQPGKGGNLQDAAAEPAWAMNSSEGGMIEFEAAGLSPSGTPRTLVAIMAGAQSVDKGLALFHAFELASLPAQSLDAEGTVAVSLEDMPPEAAVLPTDSDASSWQETARHLQRWDSRTAQQASLSAVGIVALLAAVDVVHLEGGTPERERPIPRRSRWNFSGRGRK